MQLGTRRRLSLAAAALTLTAGLAACTTGSDQQDSAAMSAPGAAEAGTATDTTAQALSSKANRPAIGAAPAAGTTGAAATGGTGATASAADVPADIAAGADRKNAHAVSVPDAVLVDRDVIYTADLTVQVDDVVKAASQIESAVRAAGGFVAGSERSTDTAPVALDPAHPELTPARQSSATLTLRIPPGDFDSVLDRVAKLGVVVQRNLTGKDVTEAVVDVKSRIASARTSVDRIRDLMDRAGTLRDVVALEGELSQREADLEALLAKQSTLKDQTSLATVTVHLETAKPVAAAAAEQDDRGFGAGLSDGWDAFTSATVAGATVVGALLPFALALLVLAPLGWWVAVRIHRTAPHLRRKVSPIEPG
jgi:hypothetical protein